MYLEPLNSYLTNDTEGWLAYGARLGDVFSQPHETRELAWEGLQYKLKRLQLSLPQPDPIPLPGWLKRIGLPTGQKVKGK